MNQTASSTLASAVTRPNYFISLRLRNKGIIQSLQTFQQSLLSSNPLYNSILIPLQTLHLTVCLLHIKNNEELVQANNLMLSTQLKDSLVSIYNRNNDFSDNFLSFKGLNHFNHRVLYADLQQNTGYNTLALIHEEFGRSFTKAGIIVPDYEKHYQPHLTLAKLSKLRNSQHKHKNKYRSNNKDFVEEKKSLNKIDCSHYAAYDAKEFGVELFQSFDLCSMLDKKAEDNYYHTTAQLHLLEAGNVRDSNSNINNSSKQTQ
jgi:2'-5' RNA ligase